MRTTMNKKIKSIAAVAALGVLCLSGTVFAYLTATDSTTNTFTIGNVKGVLTEPNYTQSSTNVFPLEVITKDPTVTNTGNTDALAFIELTVPVANVSVVSDAGKKLAAEDLELFSLINSSSEEGKVNGDWTLIKGSADVKNGDKLVGHKYVYAYNKILASEASTQSLFDKVKFINYANGSMEGNSVSIFVKADLIQADNLHAGETTVTLDELKTAYGYFDGQDNA